MTITPHELVAGAAALLTRRAGRAGCGPDAASRRLDGGCGANAECRAQQQLDGFDLSQPEAVPEVLLHPCGGGCVRGLDLLGAIPDGERDELLVVRAY